MRDPAILFVHLITTVAKLMGPGGTDSVIAESLFVLISCRWQSHCRGLFRLAAAA